VLRLTDPTQLAHARTAVERELSAIDHTCSRFRPDSELSRVNARAGLPVNISRLLMESLQLALRAAELTDGDVDPTLGRPLELAGYDRDWRQLAAPLPGHDPMPSTASNGALGDEPEPCGAITAHPRPGWQMIALDDHRGAVHMPSGIQLDLGATAKGWAADRAARAAAEAAGCGALVGIGGDIATAGTGPAGGWRVRVTDDHRSHLSAPGQTIAISCGGLATSSTTVRRWSHIGRTMHHIIDPRTGLPALATWRTASVAAASCAEANIATTAALVKGATAAAWLTEQRLPARLVDHAGHVLRIGDWPDPAAAAAPIDPAPPSETKL
jgi:FAD:protein FMN transferase